MGAFDIAHLTFRYPGAEAPALDDVCLTIEDGAFWVVCGPSGCGKTTLLRQLKPILSPHGERSGSIMLDGAPIGGLSCRDQAERVGFVLQDPDTQIVCDKVWHELAFGLENLCVDAQAIRLRVAEMASYFGIQEWFHKRVDELSGGQKQLLNLASVMAMQPRVLVLDEPTSQLDPIAARDFLATVRQINDDLGVTVVMVEHRLEDVLPMANTVLALEEGRVLAYGDPRSAAQELKGTGLFLAMPTPLRVYEGAGLGGPRPLTVREGRTWLDGSLPFRGGSDNAGFVPVQGSGADAAEARLSDEVVIRCKDLWFRYGRNEPDVVRGLSFEVRRGELYCLLGGNGAGKSTTLSLLSGLHAPYRGKVWIEGAPQGRNAGAAVRDGLVAVLPQDPQCLFVGETVRADLDDMLASMPDLTSAEAARRLERVVEQTQIGHLLDMHPYDLSGGEQQRAALAKVLLRAPRILMLDEPTKGLDAFYKEQLAQIFARLKAEGTAILMVSHDVEFCASHADRCALFFDGAIVSEGDAHSFFCGNSFYTTAANRMARHVFPGAITAEEVVAACRERVR